MHPERFTSHSQYELYFFRLYETIEDPSPIANVEYTGIIFNHGHYCEYGPSCACIPIIESYDGVKRYRKLKQKELEEEQQLAIQIRLDRDSSF